MRDSRNYYSLPYNPKLCEKARELRKAGNLSEVLVWQQVSRGNFKGYDFDRQKIIGNYIADFYCTNCHVVLEIDGQSHDNKMEKDRERDKFFESLGITVIRILADDVLNRFDDVMEMLHNHPALRAPLQRRGID